MRHNVNLLPPGEKKRVKFYHINHRFMIFGVWLILSLLIFLAVLFATKFLVAGQLEETDELVALRTQELRDLEQEFLQEDVIELNHDLENFDQLLSSHHAWSAVLIEFGGLIPSDVRLDDMEISRDAGKVSITGKAGSRDSVLQMRQNILASDLFMNVNFPLSNLEKASNVDWQYEFFIDLNQLDGQS